MIQCWTRRTFFCGLPLGVPAAIWDARAQTVGEVYRIGALTVNVIDPSSPGVFEGFLRGLRERGWLVGQNVTIEYRNGGGRAERLEQAARELVALPVDLIVAWGTVDIRAAIQATRTIPIVMGVHSADPVQAGFIASLARPGGNVTGVSPVAPELIAKRVGLLREIRPTVTRIGVIWDLAAGPSEHMEAVKPGYDAAAREHGVTWHPLPVRVAGFAVGLRYRPPTAGGGAELRSGHAVPAHTSREDFRACRDGLTSRDG